MAQCRYCNRSGFFLSISNNFLCHSCEPIFHLEYSQCFRIIQDSERLVSDSKKLEVRLSRCDLIVEVASALIKFENRNIPTTDPPPSKLVEAYRARKDLLIVEGLKSEGKEVLQKFQVTSATRTKITLLSKFLLRVRSFKGKSNDSHLLDGLDLEINRLIHETQLNSYLDEAKKAEFKGQKKKALDQYYEALYFLRNDDIDDRLQIEHISQVEAKIAELGGNIQ